jgi:hypothetical protein
MWVYELPDGGTVEPSNMHIVPMGAGGAFEKLTYRRGGVEIVFEVIDRRPVCTKVLVTPDPQTGQSVRARDLAAINLDELRGDVYTAVGVFTGGPHQWVHVSSLKTRGEDRAKAHEAARRRITPELLEQVAAVHTAATGAKVTAVADAFGVGMRTAHRYIAAAREKGLMQ